MEPMKSLRSSIWGFILFLMVCLVASCATPDSTIPLPGSTAPAMITSLVTPTFTPTTTSTIAPPPTIIPISSVSASHVVPLAEYDFDVVAASAFSFEESIFAVRKDDGTIIVWNGSSNKQISILAGLTPSFGSMAFGHDGKELVATDGKNIIVWDIFSGKQIQVLKSDVPSTFVVLSPDSEKLITFSEAKLTLWNVATGERMRTLQCVQFCGAVTFSPDSKFFAVSSFNRSLKSTITLRDSTTVEEVLTFNGEHIKQVFSVSFSPDGKMLASGDRWDFIKIWDAASGDLLKTFNSRLNDPTGGGTSEFTRGIDVSGGIDALVFSPDSAVLASSHNDGPIVIWEVSTTQPIQILRDEEYKQYFARHFTTLSFSSDGSILKSGRRNSPILFWGLEENLIRYTTPLFP